MSSSEEMPVFPVATEVTAADVSAVPAAPVPALQPQLPSSAKPMIQLTNFHKRYGDFTAVEKLNMTIPAGELFGFIGPNGAGKSTTIRFLATLLQPTSEKASSTDIASRATHWACVVRSVTCLTILVYMMGCGCGSFWISLPWRIKFRVKSAKP